MEQNGIRPTGKRCIAGSKPLHPTGHPRWDVLEFTAPPVTRARASSVRNRRRASPVESTTGNGRLFSGELLMARSVPAAPTRHRARRRNTRRQRRSSAHAPIVRVMFWRPPGSTRVVHFSKGPSSSTASAGGTVRSTESRRCSSESLMKMTLFGFDRGRVSASSDSSGPTTFGSSVPDSVNVISAATFADAATDCDAFSSASNSSGLRQISSPSSVRPSVVSSSWISRSPSRPAATAPRLLGRSPCARNPRKSSTHWLDGHQPLRTRTSRVIAPNNPVT